MNNNEIDLLQLIIQIFNFFKKNIWIFIISFTIGTIIGVLKVYLTQDNYSSNIIVNTSIEKNIVIDLVNSLSTIKNSNNVQEIQEKYKLPENFFSRIIDIQAKANDKQKEQILINVNLNTITYFDTLSIGINTFLSNNNYIKNEIESKKQGLNQLITEIDNQILILNNNQKNKYPSSKIVLLENKQLINEQINLLEKKIELVNELKLTERPIIIVKNFDDITNQKTYAKTSFIYGFVFALISFFILILFKINKISKQYSTES